MVCLLRNVLKVPGRREEVGEGGGEEEGGRVVERESGREGQRETEGVSVVGVCVGDEYKWREGSQLCTHAMITTLMGYSSKRPSTYYEVISLGKTPLVSTSYRYTESHTDAVCMKLVHM